MSTCFSVSEAFVTRFHQFCDFYQNLTAKSGYNSVCKVCYRERSKERSKKIYQNEIIIAKIFVKNKICNTCHTEKNISFFSKKK